MNPIQGFAAMIGFAVLITFAVVIAPAFSTQFLEPVIITKNVELMTDANVPIDVIHINTIGAICVFLGNVFIFLIYYYEIAQREASK